MEKFLGFAIRCFIFDFFFRCAKTSKAGRRRNLRPCFERLKIRFAVDSEPTISIESEAAITRELLSQNRRFLSLFPRKLNERECVRDFQFGVNAFAS